MLRRIGCALAALPLLVGCGGKEEGPAPTIDQGVRVRIPGEPERVITKEEIKKWPEEGQPKGAGNYALGYRAYLEGDFKEAEAQFRTSVELDPEMWQAWGHLGATLYQLHRFKEAKGCLRKAIEIEDKFADAYYNLALVYDQLGEAANALQACKRAIDLEPRDLASIRLFRRLKQKR